MAGKNSKRMAKAATKAYNEAMQKHRNEYDAGMKGTYKLYTCHSGTSSTHFGIESCCGLFIISLCGAMVALFSTQVSELPYQYGDISLYLNYNKAEEDSSPAILDNIETLCICGSMMGAIIMTCATILWYASHHLTRTHRYNAGVNLTFVMLLASWGLGWYVLVESILSVYDRCHSHNPTISDVKNPSYSYRGYHYLCKQGNSRIGAANACNIILLIMTPIYFLSNWCGKIFTPRLCCKGVQSNHMEAAAEYDLEERAHLTS